MNNIIRKLTSPSKILNWLGFRFFQFSQHVSHYLITKAIYLDPKNSDFQKNLSLLGKKKSIKKTYNIQIMSIPEYYHLNKYRTGYHNILFFDINQTVQMALPRVINKNITIPSKYACKAKLPNTYVASFQDVIVFGGTDFILIKNHLGLYDEINKDKIGYYSNKCPVIENITKKAITIKINKHLSGAIDEAIHFTKDHSQNYFHWLVECLPRLNLINNATDISIKYHDIDEFLLPLSNKTIPLLVDKDISPQAFEALQIINTDNRPLVKIDFGESYHVKKLFYPSSLSIIHDNDCSPTLYNQDIVYSPKALKFLRETILQKLNITHKEKFRKLYVSRKSSDIRKLCNTIEIEELLINKGFEIVFPENLSFTAQVKLFSQAKIIIGPTGAGMTNLVFAPEDCRILILVSDTPQMNLHIFGAIAQLLNIHLDFLMGHAKKSHKTISFPVHSDFSINIQELSEYIDEILSL